VVRRPLLRDLRERRPPGALHHEQQPNRLLQGTFAGVQLSDAHLARAILLPPPGAGQSHRPARRAIAPSR
jgi:hypothetical protein